MSADTIRRHFLGLRSGIGPAAVFTLSLGLLFLFYWPALSVPNQTFFGTYSDGLKNYFTPLYHTKYDSSLLHFGGLNYPYGEHILYADAQPILTWPIQLMESQWPGASRWTVAALNLAMLFSLVLGCLVFFLILRRLSLPDWYAALVAPAIIFFSPQVWRIGGHYSLSYTVAIPLVWLLLIRFFEKPGWGRSLTLTAVIVFWSGSHIYYLALALTLVGLMWASWLLTRQSGGLAMRLLPYLVVQALLPVSCVYAFVRATDRWLGDRAIPDEWGTYTSSLKAVFTPSYSPYLGSRFFDPLSQPEGIAYVSVLGWIGLILLAASVVLHLSGKRRGRMAAVFGPWILRASIPAALVALLIALGLPSEIPFLESALPDQLRQFRVLGRFIWVFYYVFMATAAYLVYVWYRILRLRRAVIARLVLLAVLGIFWWEVGNFSVHVSRKISNRIEELSPASDTALTRQLGRVTPGTYQALLPIPFYHRGSERYLEYFGTEPSFRNSMATSLRTGLPIIGSYMNRTSLSQTRKTLGWLKGGTEAEAFLRDLPDRRPILVVVSGGPLDDAERRLLDKARLLTADGQISLYELDVRKRSGEASR